MEQVKLLRLKKKEKGLKIILIIDFIILAILLAYYFYGTCFNKNKVTSTYASWMSGLKDESKISEVVLPGSHDAGTDEMIFEWSTQNSPIKDQLEMGTRYFDLRVNYTLGNYYVFHDAMIGHYFLEILDDITNFISTHQSETLILHFQHFRNGADEKIKPYLKEKLVDQGLVVINNTNESDLAFLSNVTLKDTRGKCIIVYGKGYTPEDYMFSEGDSLETYYEGKLNKLSSQEFISKGLPVYIDDIKEKINKTGYKGLFVLQCQLTDKIYIRGPWSLERGHDSNISAYINNLKDSDDFNVINIVMRDFVNERKNGDIISLNKYKSLMK